MLKVLLVDDSALMRQHLREIFNAAGGFETCTARDGEDALMQIREFHPDVVTLDVNMPVMDGLTCLSRIMVETPCPVVMVSSLTEKGALATLEALQMGAVDYIPKPNGTVSTDLKQIGRQIVDKVRAAAGARPRRRSGLSAAPPPAAKLPTKPATQPARVLQFSQKNKVVLIGTSTGGPGTLQDILPLLPADFPHPVVVAQHMPATFTRAMATRLDGLCPLKVQEVSGVMPLSPGTIYIGRGDADVIVQNRLGERNVRAIPAATEYLWHPSVERLVCSALDCFAATQLIAVELTGMGYDGAAAMTEVRKGGGHTIAESEATAVVFGMPKELIDMGGAETVLPATQIAAQIVAWA